MILRASTLKPVPKKKRINLSAMLTSEYFFHRSIQIQMALNQDRVLPRDYLIKKAKAKINTGKKKKIKENKNKDEIDSSYERNREKDKKEIPDELDKILEESKKKFAVQNNKYQSLKQYNDIISGYWHYINKKSKKEEREILFKRYFSQDNKNMINLHSEHLQKYCLNIFKSNPLLMRKKNAEMFFHYLSEFNKYYKDENKFSYVKQKIVLFLEKLRDFLDYVKIKADKGLDSISKDIKIKNSKFIREMEIKVKQDLQKMKEKKSIINKNDIKESEKMINKTKETLQALFENKTIFEEPIYFDPTYNKKFILKSRNFEYKYKYSYNYNNKNLSMPNIKKDNKDNYFPNKTAKMSTVSTGFYIPDKNKNKDIDSNKKDDILIKDSNRQFKKIKINKNKIGLNRSMSSSGFSFGKKNNLIDILKKNEQNKLKKDLAKNDNNNANNIEIERTSLRDSISSSINNDFDNNNINNINNIHNLKKLLQNNSSSNNNINSNRKSEEENIAKILSSTKYNNNQKKARDSSISINKDKDNSKDSVNFRKKSGSVGSRFVGYK